MKGRTVFGIAICCFVLLFSVQARAIVLDFLDNVACPPGLYGLAYYSYYTAPDLKDDGGHNLKTASGKDLDLTLHQLALRPVYYGKAGSALWAANAIVPVGRLEARNFTTERKQSSSGIGDIMFGPAIFLFQEEKSMTALSFWEFVSAPTGPFSKGRARQYGTNYGLGYWYLQHQLAFATSFYDKSPISYDMNISYYQKFDGNHQEPADSMEVEGILGYGITPAIRVGVYGVYYWDLKKGEDINGYDILKKKAFSAGPSIAYGTEKWGLNFRWVKDFDVENTTKGDYLFLRFSYAF